MEKIKRVLFMTLLTAVVSVTAACGRNNTDNGSSAAPTSSLENDTSSEAGMEQETTYESGATNGSVDESGGVLRDMVDGVENGLDDLGNDLESGNVENGENAVNP